MMTCIIIEDQPPAQKILQKYIGSIEVLALKKTFSDAIEALEYLESNETDLVFLDIHLPRMSGIDFLKSLKTQPYIVLTSSYSDYALESYEYNVTDYLLKPFSLDRFKQAINKVMSLSNSKPVQLSDPVENSGGDIYLKSGHDIVKVKCEDILHIQSDADYTEVITTSKKYVLSYSLKDWVAKLDHNFCQVHKSHIINLIHLKKISHNKVYLSGDHVIPIGRAYKKGLMERFGK